MDFPSNSRDKKVGDAARLVMGKATTGDDAALAQGP